MRYSIENECLYVEIDTHGAELMHVNESMGRTCSH